MGMTIKITMDHNAVSLAKSAALQKIKRELGSKVRVSNDEIFVQEYDESKVIDILNRERVNYSRST